MKLTQLKIVDDPHILAYIEDFLPNQVVLDNYFFATKRNLFSNFNYTKEEIALVLNLTDKEYAEVLISFLTNTSSENQETVLEIAELKNKIETLEAKLNASRELEDAQKKVNQLQLELKKIESELAIYNEFEAKHNEAEKEFAEWAYLGKYNLNKIHEDLVSIDAQIQQHDQKLLETKTEFIGYNTARKTYDNGKIVLAIFWGLGVLMISAALYILKISMLVVSIGAVAGLLVSFFIILSAKIEYEYPEEIENLHEDPQTIEDEVARLKYKKSQLLNLVGVKTPDEFFQLKAQYQGYEKKLKTVKDLKANVIKNTEEFEVLKTDQDKIKQELDLLMPQLSNTSLLLTPEQYLTTRREIDNIRMQVNQKVSSQGDSRTTLALKLENLRKELGDKIPDYINLLTQTFSSSFDRLYTEYDSLCSALNLIPNPIEANGDGFEQLPDLHKVLYQYVLMRDIYKENFVFAIDKISTWSDQDRVDLQKLFEIFEERVTKFYVLDYSINFS